MHPSTEATFDTQAAKPEPCGDKWRAAFKSFVTRDGRTHLLCSCASAPLFATELDAWAAAERALEHLQRTGAFPNMCEPF